MFLQTKGEKPEFSIDVINIQSVEEVDDGAFGQALCFQVCLVLLEWLAYLSLNPKIGTEEVQLLY